MVFEKSKPFNGKVREKYFTLITRTTASDQWHFFLSIQMSTTRYYDVIILVFIIKRYSSLLKEGRRSFQLIFFSTPVNSKFLTIMDLPHVTIKETAETTKPSGKLLSLRHFLSTV